jgi:transcriptional regulator of NAD metabolism
MKNLLYLNKYKQKKSENTKFIIENLFKILFNKNLREETFLSRSVIIQNIRLLRAKEK